MSNEDYYFNENGLLVFTKEYHLKRGSCCGNGCINCPFMYENVKNKELKNKLMKTYISRLDGSEKPIPDTPEDFGEVWSAVTNLFATNRDIIAEKGKLANLKALKANWNYSDKILQSVVDFFEEDLSGAEEFMEIYDSEQDLDLSWAIWRDHKGIN